MNFRDPLLGRPPLWLRLAAIAGLVKTGFGLVGEHQPNEILTAVFFGALLLTVAIAPRALYDDDRGDSRDAWARTHPVRSGIGTALFLGLCLYLLLAEFLDSGLSLLIAVPSTAVLSLLATWWWSRQSERTGAVEGVG